MLPTITVKDKSAFATFEGLDDKVRERFTESIRRIQQTILNEARANAVGHFHTIGVKPGSYLAAFQGGVKTSGPNVIGWVRNGHPIAHLMEGGAKAHDILPRAAQVLAFEGSAGTVFAKLIHSPGFGPFPAIGPAFAAHAPEVEAAARKAIEDL